MNIQETIAQLLEDVRGMWRYRWSAAGAAWIVAAFGWLFVYSMPDVYEASAKLYLDTTSLMEPVFSGLALSDDVNAQIDAVRWTLLTRPSLESVARQTDLDLRAASRQELEELVTNLQRRIEVTADTRRNTFAVTFRDRNAKKAQEVVSIIVDRFVTNSVQEQGEDAQLTGQALDAEIENHEQRLIAAEERLARFRSENVGFMPTSRGGYFQRLQASLRAIEGSESRLRALTERREELKRQLEGESRNLSPLACSQLPEIVQLQAQLAALRVDFTDKHPRIITLKGTIGALIDRCEAQLDSGRLPVTGPQPSDGETVAANPVYQDLRMLLTQTELEITALRSRLTNQRSDVAKLRANVDKIAQVEANLKTLDRDYGVVQRRYQQLIERRETLRSKQRLEPVTSAIPFRILEPPFVASDPAGPPRTLFMLAVLVVAIGAGGALAFGLSQLNPTFFSRQAVKRVVGLPVLGSVSFCATPQEARSRRLATLAWCGSYLALSVAAVFAVIFQSQAGNLLRNVVERLSA